MITFDTIIKSVTTESGIQAPCDDVEIGECTVSLWADGDGGYDIGFKRPYADRASRWEHVASVADAIQRIRVFNATPTEWYKVQ